MGAAHFIGDVLLVKLIHVDLLLAVACPEKLHEVSHELAAEVVDVLLGVFPDDEQLSHVALRLRVHLEAVCVSALLFAGLAVPS